LFKIEKMTLVVIDDKPYVVIPVEGYQALQKKQL
jgi:hypothetical protein